MRWGYIGTIYYANDTINGLTVEMLTIQPRLLGSQLHSSSEQTLQHELGLSTLVWQQVTCQMLVIANKKTECIRREVVNGEGREREREREREGNLELTVRYSANWCTYEFLGWLNEGTHFITKLVLQVDESPWARLNLSRWGRLLKLNRQSTCAVDKLPCFGNSPIIRLVPRPLPDFQCSWEKQEGLVCNGTWSSQPRCQVH